MLIYLVEIVVKPECSADFITATLENARCSQLEPGIMRFELARRDDDPNRFVLIEGYRSPEAVAAHKETAHYLTWRDAVGPMMAEPRRGTKYTPLVPVPDMLA